MGYCIKIKFYIRMLYRIEVVNGCILQYATQKSQIMKDLALILSIATLFNQIVMQLTFPYFLV